MLWYRLVSNGAERRDPSLPISRKTAFRIDQTSAMLYCSHETAPVRTVKASPLSNAKVIKRVTLVARAIAKNGRTARTSRKVKAPAIKPVSK